jgi:hypothetical protein
VVFDEGLFCRDGNRNLSREEVLVRKKWGFCVFFLFLLFFFPPCVFLAFAGRREDVGGDFGSGSMGE